MAASTGRGAAVVKIARLAAPAKRKGDERRRPPFRGGDAGLADAIVEGRAHVVQQQVAEERDAVAIPSRRARARWRPGTAGCASGPRRDRQRARRDRRRKAGEIGRDKVDHLARDLLAVEAGIAAIRRRAARLLPPPCRSPRRMAGERARHADIEHEGVGDLLVERRRLRLPAIAADRTAGEQAGAAGNAVAVAIVRVGARRG